MRFTKPKGATADLREIEYISALHQTGETLRKDGTINAADISLFLMSRYGIDVTADEVSNTISKGFGGGGISESDGNLMDLTEVVAMLFIPTLIRIKGEITKHTRDSDDNDNFVDDFNVNCGDEYDADDHVVNKSDVPLNSSKSSTNKYNRSLFQYVLQMIVADTVGESSYSPPITVELLRNIFLFYGEKDVASDTNLLEGMVELALTAGENLDAAVFAHCCTSDVELYDVGWENKLTTNYNDVFETMGSAKESERGSLLRQSMDDVEGNVTGRVKGKEEVNEVPMKYTFPSIDYAVDTFRSKTYVILLWFTWVLFYINFIGVFNGTNPDVGDLHCGNYPVTTAKGFWCGVGQGVINWLKVMFKLVFLGSIFVMGASIGHSTSPRNPLLVVVSMGFIAVYTFLPIFKEYVILPNSDGTKHELSTKKTDYEIYIFTNTALFSVAVFLILFCVQNILDRSLPTAFIEKHKGLQQVLASGSLYMERNMKKAASYKVNRMIRNALDIHNAAAKENNNLGKESSYGRALLSYSKVSDAKEEIGGHMWTWNGLRTGRLYEEEGIWLSNRVMQGNLGQLFLCLILIPIIIEMSDVSQALFALVQAAYESFGAEFIMPNLWRIYVPLGVAFLFAEINSFGLVTVYIPSTVRTTLRFRSGEIGSLHDDEFQKMRTQLDQASFIFGSMFWGCFLSNVLVLGVAWVVASIFCLPSFLPNLLKFISTFIGLAVTIFIKQILLRLARSKFSGKTFYRSNPAVANCISVLLEAWNLGISVFFVFIRMITLVITAFIYVARVDIPFLSDSADEVGGAIIDKWPFVFRKDMLQHEAHRHPYLERIGVMYMLKLRHGDRFGSTAGTSWRLLLVFALLPWLRKYRIRGEDPTTNTIESAAENDSAAESFRSSASSNAEVEELKREISRLKSENDRLTSSLAKSKTEDDF